MSSQKSSTYDVRSGQELQNVIEKLIPCRLQCSADKNAKISFHVIFMVISSFFFLSLVASRLFNMRFACHLLCIIHRNTALKPVTHVWPPSFATAFAICIATDARLFFPSLFAPARPAHVWSTLRIPRAIIHSVQHTKDSNTRPVVAVSFANQTAFSKSSQRRENKWNLDPWNGFHSMISILCTEFAWILTKLHWIRSTLSSYLFRSAESEHIKFSSTSNWKTSWSADPRAMS